MREANNPVSSRVAAAVERRSGTLVMIAVLATALLAIPFLAMAPEETASQEPGGPVFDAQELVNDRFASDVYGAGFIVEARDGNILTRDALLELFENEQALRDDPDVGGKLISFFDPATRLEIDGILTFADGVDDALRAQGVSGLAAATDAQVDAAVAFLLEQRSPFEWNLSTETTRDTATGRWVAPAVFAAVFADNQALGGGGQEIRLGGDTQKEEFARDVQTLLRGDEVNIQAWGIAIDVNLTSGEQGQAAGPFIGFTILAVLLIVGATFRSYWAVAVTGGALAALIVWLKGLSNLIGLENDQILSTIVPIAMISFGVDFAFHAIGRYREERLAKRTARSAFVGGMAAVLAALVLALASDSAAFLSNVSSSIESIVQFGLAAALALAAAFFMLGIITPLVLMLAEERSAGRPRTRFGTFLAVNAAGLAAAGAMAAVLFMVYILPAAGVGILAVYVIAFLLIPYFLAGRRARRVEATPAPVRAGGGSPAIGRLVTGAAHHRAITLTVALLVSGAAAYFALQIEATFDVRDFFAADTDLVVSLDKLDEHVGEQGGEPAVVYIEGDLTQPEALAAISSTADQLGGMESEFLARDDTGAVIVGGGVLWVIEEVMESPFARATIGAAQGIEITDADGNGLPDTDGQLAGIYRFTRQFGVPIDEARLAITPDGVRTQLWEDEAGTRQATTLVVQLLGTRAQENIRSARDDLSPLVDGLAAELQAADPSGEAILTGSPIGRDEQLIGILRSLLVALPISVALCFVIAATFMRSFRYGLVSTIPILLVVTWLYAFMHLAGYGVNVVTATIGAISIGIGIDFAIHFTMRYRQEMKEHPTRIEALGAAGAGTGAALVASATSSIVGFAILAAAPMPMFSSYGLLTAVMIFMALVASLLVLPSLLMLVTRDTGVIPVEPPSPAPTPAVTGAARR